MIKPPFMSQKYRLGELGCNGIEWNAFDWMMQNDLPTIFGVMGCFPPIHKARRADSTANPSS